MVEIGLGFLSGQQFVEFAGDEILTCGGTPLSVHGHIASFQVLRAPAAQEVGTTVHCDYSVAGAVAGFTLLVPTPPTITAPRAGTQVQRGMQTIVTYTYDSTTCCTMLGIVALAPSSPSPKAIARMNTPGPLHATIDTSGFTPGSGVLALTAGLTPRISEAGVPFRSAEAFGSASVTVPVTWV